LHPKLAASGPDYQRLTQQIEKVEVNYYNLSQGLQHVDVVVWQFNNLVSYNFAKRGSRCRARGMPFSRYPSLLTGSLR